MFNNRLKISGNVEIDYLFYFKANFHAFDTFHESYWSASNIGTLAKSRPSK